MRPFVGCVHRFKILTKTGSDVSLEVEALRQRAEGQYSALRRMKEVTVVTTKGRFLTEALLKSIFQKVTHMP